MPMFLYEGVTAGGQKTKGEFEAPNLAAAQSKLKAQQIRATSVKQKGSLMALEIKIPGLKARIREKDLVLFTRQFATMIDAGLPLVQCLDIQSQQLENATFREQLAEIKETVEAGSTFADALRKHPKTFGELYVNLVQAGEVGGILDTILNRLAAYIEKSMALKGKIKGAMIMPAIILTVMVAVVIIILWKVIPTFAELFGEYGADLPSLTIMVIKLSNFVGKNIVLVAVSIVVLVVGFIVFYRWDTGRKIVDDVTLKVPVFGPLVRKSAIARFTRTLGTMVASGVPILDALDICARTAGNKTVERALFMVKDAISEGKTIADPLAESKVFPPMVVQMISVGEATGALDTMLGKIAEFYDEEVDRAVDGLTTLMEPMIMIILGLVVGTLVIAMYLPIFTLTNVIV